MCFIWCILYDSSLFFRVVGSINYYQEGNTTKYHADVHLSIMHHQAQYEKEKIP